MFHLLRRTRLLQRQKFGELTSCLVACVTAGGSNTSNASVGSTLGHPCAAAQAKALANNNIIAKIAANVWQ
jgi:hypothetical protein